MNNAGETRSPPPRRRLLQFSLRTLLVLVAACAVWLGIAFLGDFEAFALAFPTFLGFIVFAWVGTLWWQPRRHPAVEPL